MDPKDNDKEAPREKTYSKTEFEAAEQKAFEARAENEDLRRRLKDLEEGTVKKLKKDLETLRGEKALTSAEELESWKKETEKALRAAVQSNLNELSESNKNLGRQLREYKIVEKAFSPISARFSADNHEELKEKIRRYGDLDEAGNIIFKDDSGKVRYMPGSANEPLTVEGFASDLLEKRPSWASNTTASGTGRPGGYAPSGSGNGSKLPPAHVIRAMGQKDLQDLAGKLTDSERDQLLAIRTGLPLT